MKELHNHIFSNTTCISKETMLRYINKQLSKKEVHEVEKHMLDCELCTEAYEGMSFATNSSMLFAIDNLIDQKANKGVKKAPIIRNLMVAASVLVIVFGAYITFDLFNHNGGKQEIADNKNEQAPENFIIEEKTKEVEEQEQLPELLPVLGETSQSDRAIPAIEESNSERIVVEKEIIAEADFEDVLVMDDEVEMEEAEIAPIPPITSKAEDIVNADNTVADNYRREDVVDELITTTNSRNSNTNDLLKDEMATLQNNKSIAGKSDKKKSKNRQEKTQSNAPAYAAEANAMGNVSSDESVPVERQNTYTIYTYKVYDYVPEYQNQYDFKKDVELKTVDADFANEEDKDIAQKELEKTTVEITYKQTLEAGIKFVKEEKYQLALTQFELILKTHTEDVNGLFYGGISQYHLAKYDAAVLNLDKTLQNKKTVFNQEAKWYKALSLIGLKKNKAAKIVLQEIINANGFYKDQASQKLDALK